MIITRSRAVALMAGIMPDYEAYRSVADFVAKDGSPMTIGAAGCVLAWGARIAEDRPDLAAEAATLKAISTAAARVAWMADLQGDAVNITAYQSTVGAEEAFAAFESATAKAVP